MYAHDADKNIEILASLIDGLTCIIPNKGGFTIMTLARERHERRGKNALFRWSKLSVPSSFFDILIG